jgi:hypothetical protein
MMLKTEQCVPYIVNTLAESEGESSRQPGAMQCGSFASSQLQSASGLVNASYMSPDIRHEFARDIPHCTVRQIYDSNLPVLSPIVTVCVMKVQGLTVWT